MSFEKVGDIIKRIGRFSKTDCPLCEGKNMLVIDPRRHIWHCFNCNVGGAFSDLKRLVDNKGGEDE